MKLVETSINKPVSVAVGVIFVILFGIISLYRIPVQLTPDVEKPRITVSTFWEGASPYEIESEVIREQEDKLKAVEGLVEMTRTYTPITTSPTITSSPLSKGSPVSARLTCTADTSGRCRLYSIRTRSPREGSRSSTWRAP